MHIQLHEVRVVSAGCDDIIRQHKAACLRVTALLAHGGALWVGTSAGVLLTAPLRADPRSAPVLTGTGPPQGYSAPQPYIPNQLGLSVPLTYQSKERSKVFEIDVHVYMKEMLVCKDCDIQH